MTEAVPPREPIPAWSAPVISTLALSALTLLGYGFALSFEIGYLGDFGVPVYLVEIGLRESLICAGITLLIILCIAYLFAFLPAKSWGGLLWQMLPVVMLGGLLWEIIFDERNEFGDWQKTAFAFVALLFAVMFVLNLVVPVRRRTGPLLDRFKHEALGRKDPLAGTVTSAVLKFADRGTFPFGSVVITFGFLTVIICLAYWIVGFEVSRMQVRYELVDARQPCAVVAKSADALICAELTPSHKMLTGAIELLKLDEGRPLRMRNQYLGHLRSAVDPSR